MCLKHLKCMASLHQCCTYCIFDHVFDSLHKGDTVDQHEKVKITCGFVLNRRPMLNPPGIHVLHPRPPATERHVGCRILDFTVSTVHNHKYLTSNVCESEDMSFSCMMSAKDMKGGKKDLVGLALEASLTLAPLTPFETQIM